MTDLITDIVNVKKKIYEYIILITIISITILTIRSIYINKKIKSLSQNYQKLEIQKQVLQTKINTQIQDIVSAKKNADDKELLVAEKDKQIAILNKKIDNLQKTKNIKVANNTEEVKQKIYTLYKDKDVEFTKENKYSFTIPTTYHLVYDAENWNVNGPILIKNNKLLTEANTGLRQDIDLKSSFILDLKKVQLNQNNLIVSLNNKDQISNEQIKNLQKTLVLKDEKNIYKIVGSFFAGAITYYVLEKTRNR